MQRVKNNEFGYLGNPSVKRDGVEASFTKEEVKEYAKCMKDPFYFANNYVKIISLDEGLDLTLDWVKTNIEKLKLQSWDYIHKT